MDNPKEARSVTLTNAEHELVRVALDSWRKRHFEDACEAYRDGDVTMAEIRMKSVFEADRVWHMLKDA